MRVTHVGRIPSSAPPVAQRSILLELPVPPSVNSAFATSQNGGRHHSQTYNAWETQAGWEIKQQRSGRIMGPVEVSIVIGKRKQRSDIDNRIKPLLDLLVKHQIIEADHDACLQRVSAEWSIDISRARVEIRPIAAEAESWIQRRNLARPRTTKGGHTG